MGVDIRNGSPYYMQAVCTCADGGGFQGMAPHCCASSPPPPPQPAPSPPVATPAPVPTDGPEITGSGGSAAPSPETAEPTIDEVYPDDEEPEDEGAMAWFKQEDLLSMPNWSWIALLLVIILGSCSCCCVLLMTR